VGLASYYAAKFHGRRTASGEKFNSKMLTAAHLTLPFGTQLKVTNLQNMKSVIVRVNDRGPHIRGRIVDLSRAAAQVIGLTQTGTARVVLEVLQP
jgi:rare lipoprotein A